MFAPAAFDAAKLDAYAFASRKTPEYMHYRLISCPSCDLLYANPVPSTKALAEAYKEAAYGSSEEARFAARTYAALIDGILGRLPDRAGALDIGAGDGAFLEELLARGFTEVVGVEPSEAPIAAASAAVKPLLRRGVFAAAGFKPGTLSLVTSFQTLEHVDDPLQVCRDARSLLREGGAAIFVCHNRRALSARILGFKSPIFDIEHLQLFSPASAWYLLDAAGFSDITVRPIWNSYPLHYWLKLLPLPSALKGKVVAAAKDSAWGRRTVALPAGNLAAIGWKPR